MNTRASLLATVSHHIMHYSVIFWIRGLSRTLCFQRISEKEYTPMCLGVSIHTFLQSKTSPNSVNASPVEPQTVSFPFRNSSSVRRALFDTETIWHNYNNNRSYAKNFKPIFKSFTSCLKSILQRDGGQ